MTRSRWWEVVGGGLLIVLGLLFLADTLGYVSAGRTLAVFWPLVLILLGLFIMWGSRRWRWSGGRLGGAVGDIRIGAGEWDLRDMDTRMLAGEVRIDLGRARIPPGETILRVGGGMGNIQILVPDGLSIAAHAEVGAGSISLLGHKAEGIFRQLSFTSPDYATADRKVKVDMSLFMGEASIVRRG